MVELANGASASMWPDRNTCCPPHAPMKRKLPRAHVPRGMRTMGWGGSRTNAIGGHDAQLGRSPLTMSSPGRAKPRLRIICLDNCSTPNLGDALGADPASTSVLVTTCARGNLRSTRTQRLCTTRGWHRPKEHQCAARKLIYEPKTPHSGNHKSNGLHKQGCNRYVNEGLLATPTRHLNTALRTPLTPAPKTPWQTTRAHI